MSKQKKECPLYNPYNCKEYNNPQLCAFVREDRTCKKRKKPRKKSKNENEAKKSQEAEKTDGQKENS